MQSAGRAKQLPRSGRPYMPGYEVMFDKRRKNLPWTWAVRRLTNSHNYWLVSTWPGGRPHSMPVWGVWLDGSFFFSTGRLSRKSKNLQAAPNCIVCPEDAAEAVILEGVAETSTEPSMFRRFAHAYKKKYDWDMAGTKDPVYRVRPRRAFGFVETPSKTRGNPTRWLFPGHESTRA